MAKTLFICLGTTINVVTIASGASNSAAASGQMQVVQVCNNIDDTGTNHNSFTVNCATTAGSNLIAFVREGSSPTDAFTISDSAGQTWTQTASGYESVNYAKVGMFYKVNSAAVTSVTANFTTGPSRPSITVLEIANGALSSFADGSVNTGTAPAGSALTSGALATTDANDILIYGVGVGDDQTSWTPGSGFSIPNNNVAAGSNGSNIRTAVSYKIVTTTQSLLTTMGWSTNVSGTGLGILAAFKAAGSSVPVSSGSSSVSLNPIAVTGGASSTGTVTLSGMAPTGGAVVSLSSNNTAVATVPGSVKVAAGSATATFTVKTGAVSARSTATITATYNGTASTALTVNPPAAPGQLSLSQTSFAFGNVDIGTTVSQIFTVSNTGSAKITLSNVSVSGAGFGATGVSTGATLSPGQSITLTATFTPATAAAVKGGVVFTSNAANTSATIALSGKGVQPPTTHSVVLKWSPSTSSDVIGYYIYRGGASAGPFTALNASPISTTIYKDSTVQAGQVYYYVVTSVDSSHTQSAYSSPVSATVP